MSVRALISVQDSGVYRAPDGIEFLRAHAKEGGAVWFEADLARARDKAQVLEVMARVCGFPGTFGANWDALADSVQDFSWRPAPGYVLHLGHAAAAAQALGRDWSTFIQILDATVAYWKHRGKAFVVLVDDVAELPAWK